MIYTYILDFSGADASTAEKLVDKYLDESTRAYVEKTKNKPLKLARSLTYSALFFVLREKFSLTAPLLCRTHLGKPYVTEKACKQKFTEKITCENGMSECQVAKTTAPCDEKRAKRGSTDLEMSENFEKSQINISISHTDGFAAIAVSNDGKTVGVDIQKKSERGRTHELEERYFSEVSFGTATLDTELLLIEIKGGGFSIWEDVGREIKENDYENAEIGKIKITKKSPYSFFEKWAVFEATVKCDGGGIGARKKLSELIEKSKYSLLEFRTCEDVFYISTVCFKATKESQ